MLLKCLRAPLLGAALILGQVVTQMFAMDSTGANAATGQPVLRLRESPEWKQLDGAVDSRDEDSFIGVLESNPRFIAEYEFKRWPGHYPLLVAIDLGWPRLFEFLLKRGETAAGISEFIPRHRVALVGPLSSALSPLHRAAQLHRPEFVRRLLAAGADVNATNRLGATPLALAVRSQPQTPDAPPDSRSGQSLEADRLETVLILLRTGANPLWRLPATGEAVPRGLSQSPDFLTEFILTNARPDVARGPDGDDLIHAAAKACATNALEVLLARGMQPDRTNHLGRTPLHVLAMTPAPMVKPRPEAGDLYSFQYRDRYYGTRAAIAQRLLEAGLRHDVFSAAGLGDTNVLSALLITNVALINKRDPVGDTPLHWAARSGAWPATKLLLARGADSTVTNLAGNTPLHLALGAEDQRNSSFLRFHGPEVVAELLQSKVPLETINRDGLAVLAVAALHGTGDAVKQLLARGAKVNPTNALAKPPLLLAAESNHEDLINLFLDYGADPKVRDSKGQPVLHILLEHTASLEVIEHLVSNRGFSIDDRDRDGDTLLHRAMLDPGAVRQYTPPPNVIQNLGQRFKPVEQALEKLEEKHVLEASPSPRQFSVARFLLMVGSDPNAKNELGETPLHLLGRDEADSGYSGFGPPTERDRKAFRAELTAAKLLLDSGARIDAQDLSGETPLGRALRMKRLTWAALLQELGAKE